MNVLKKRWGYLAMAVLVLLFMGIGYAFSLFVVPIEQDLGLTRADTSFVFTLCFICFALGSLVTGFMVQKIPPRYLLRAGACMICAGFLLSARVTKLWQLYVTYSICCGYAIGIAYNIMISLLPLYFHDRIGIATGTLLMGYAMSTTVLGPPCQSLMSADGWRFCFVARGICGAIVLALGSVMIHVPTKEQEPYLPKSEDAGSGGLELPPYGMLHTKTYFVFLTIYITIGGVGMSFINHGAMILQEDFALSAGVSAVLVGFICLFNGIGRVLWGIIYDKIGGARSLRYLGGLLVAGMAVSLGALLFKNSVCSVVGMALILFIYGGSSSLAPIIVRALFGNRYFSMNFAVTNIGTMILSSVPALIGSLQTVYHNYLVPYLVLAALSLVALLMACLYQVTTRKELQLNLSA